MNTYVKFLTNIAEFITFKFDQPKEYPNKFKPGELQYSYGVEWKGQDAYLTATPKLNQLLQALPKRQGETIQILKYEDGTAKLWKIMDIQGNDITPQTSPQTQNAPTSHVNHQQTQIPIPQPNQSLQPNFDPSQFLTKTQFNEILDKQRKAFREMDEKVKEITRQLEYIKEMMKTNGNSWEMHKDMLPPLEKPIEPQEETDPELQKALDEITI